MKRWIVVTLAVSVALLAAVFALLNEASVRLDFHFFTLHLPLGVVVTASLLCGFLIASLVLALTVIVPQRMRLRTLRRRLESSGTAGSPEP